MGGVHHPHAGGEGGGVGGGGGKRKRSRVATPRRSRQSPQFKWAPITQSLGAMPKGAGPSPQLEGPRRSMGVQNPILGPKPKRGRPSPNSSGHTEGSGSMTPTPGAPPKRMTLHRNYGDHTKQSDSISPNGEATEKLQRPSSRLRGPRRSLGVRHPTPGAKPKHGSPSCISRCTTKRKGASHQLEGRVLVPHPDSSRNNRKE